MSDAVDAILMASGFSMRFGAENKLLAPFLGRPLVEHALELACSMAEIRRTIVVAADRAVIAIARSYAVEVIENRRPERGMCESIRLGVEASDAESYLFLACDQPLLDARSVRLLLDGRDGRSILRLSGAARAGLPSLFPRDLRRELTKLRDGESGRAVIARHPERLQSVPAPDPIALEDIDTPDDLAGLLQLVKGRTVP